MVTTDDILRLAQAYADAHGIELVTVSSRVFDDGKKIAALRAGGDLTLKRCSAALQWFSNHWPDDKDWPKSIERPAKTRCHA